MMEGPEDEVWHDGMLDISGTYFDQTGNCYVLTQNGNTGTSDGGWGFTVSGTALTTTDGLTGGVAESPGSRTLVWSNGLIFRLDGDWTEQACQDVSGTYLDLEGNKYVLSQTGNTGTTDGGWFFFVSGTTVSNSYGLIGELMDMDGTRSIAWSSAVVFTQIPDEGALEETQRTLEVGEVLEQTCVDVSGAYLDHDGNEYVLTQAGDTGVSDGGWTFSVAGAVVSNSYGLTGSFAEEQGAKTIAWSDGTMFMSKVAAAGAPVPTEDGGAPHGVKGYDMLPAGSDEDAGHAPSHDLDLRQSAPNTELRDQAKLALGQAKLVLGPAQVPIVPEICQSEGSSARTTSTQACIDLSGTYVDAEGKRYVLSQAGAYGTSDTGWDYSVSGARVMNSHGEVGRINETMESRTIAWTSGVIFTLEGVPTEVPLSRLDGEKYTVAVVRSEEGESGFAVVPCFMTLDKVDKTRTDLQHMNEGDMIIAVNGNLVIGLEEYLTHAKGVQTFSLTMLRPAAKRSLDEPLCVEAEACPACGNCTFMPGGRFCPECGERRPHCRDVGIEEVE